MQGSRDWSTKLLLGRGRSDDTPENIKRRLDWFEQDVVAVIEYYKKHHAHTIIEINAEQIRENVHAEIISKLKGLDKQLDELIKAFRGLKNGREE